MAHEREVLRLYFKGLSQRDICAATRCGHSTVSNLIKAARESQITWEAASAMQDSDLSALLSPRISKVSAYAQPDLEKLSKELTRAGVTRKLLWHEYCSSISDAATPAYGYAQFCRILDRHLRIDGARMHLTHEPAQRMFVDWAGDSAEVIAPVTGAVSKAWLFVACLPYSAYIFAKAYFDMKQASWLDGHMSAFEHFGGVPAIIVPDNCATATDRGQIYLTCINQTYYDFATYYQTAIVPARVRKPNDKALVESSVLICERKVLAPLRDERFFSIDELNCAIEKRVAKINDALFQKREGSRAEVFFSEERDLLGLLPTSRYEITLWKRVKVSMDYHVSIDTQRYSVPYSLIGQTLEVALTSAEVTIVKDNQVVAKHRRLCGRKGQYSTERDHMPPAHQAYDTQWTPERYRRWAASIGPETLAAIDAVLDSKVIVEQAYVPCINILNLAKGSRRELLEAACKEVMSRGAYPTYTLIKNTMAALKGARRIELEEGTDQPDDLGDAGKTRGAAYYRMSGGSHDDN